MYRALYRKWRPRRFEDVVGQQAIVAALQNQVAANRVGHAYLFTGTRGTGKTSCAKIFAKAINCTNPNMGDPCCECAVCAGIEQGGILDVVEIDAASNNGVDSIRDLRDETAYTPSVCAYKVFIIDEVHMLSIAAFNALLKIMEEPPSHVVFILATTEIHKVPATILSRCQRYDFGRILPEDIAARVASVAAQEGLQLDENAAALIARLADGALRDALSILDTCAGVSTQIDEPLVRRMAGVTDRSYLFAISDALGRKDALAALEQVAELRQRSVDMKRLCEELIAHYRNLMLGTLSGGKKLLAGVPPEEEALYLQKASEISTGQSVNAIRLLGSALEKMSRGTDPRIELELALFALTEKPAPAPTLAQPAPQQNPTNAFAAASAQPFAAGTQPFAAAPIASALVQSAPAPQPAAETDDLPPWDTAPAQSEPMPKPSEKADEYADSAEQAPIDEAAPIAATQPEDAPPWETEPIQPAEVPVPAPPRKQAPPAQKPTSALETPELFAEWPAVLKALQKDKMLTGYLKNSKAYCDGVRVLIDGGDTFRDFIRTNKECREKIKLTIEQVVGKRYGIGPYIAPTEQTEAISADDTLRVLQEMGVEVVFNDKE